MRFSTLTILTLSSLIRGSAIDDLIPTFEIGPTNILFDTLLENVDKIPEIESSGDINSQVLLKNKILKIPSENSFVISNKLQFDAFDVNFDPKNLTEADREVEAMFFAKKKIFYQYFLSGAGVRTVEDDAICVPNNTTSIAGYSYSKAFGQSSGFNVAVAFSRIFGFAPKAQLGFDVSSSSGFEVSCDVKGGKFLQVGKMFEQYFWSNVTRREIIVTTTPFRKTEIEYRELDYFPEITLVNKSNLMFSCISRKTCKGWETMPDAPEEPNTGPPDELLDEIVEGDT